MKKILTIMAIMLSAMTINAKTLIVYYSYTNNVHNICTELQSQTGADMVRIEPAEKELDYAANNYAIGSALIAAIRNNPNDASSYPAIDPVDVNLDDYDVVLIGAPLWWSNMAAPLQSYLFQNGAKMAGKKIGLIVSSASSGISGVESDAKRLIPDGDFLSPSLWIRSSQTSSCRSMIQNWLTQIGYNDIASVINGVRSDSEATVVSIHTINGKSVAAQNLSQLGRGIYIIRSRLSNGNINTKKIVIKA